MSDAAPGTVPAPRAALIERLARQHHRALVAFLRRRLGSEHEARDVAQDAYLRLLRHDAPEAIGYLKAFLFTTAERLAFDRLRTRARHRRLAGTVETALGARVAGAPEGLLAAREELALIAAALDELPERCRRAFWLRRVEGWSTARVAAHLRLPERTVRHYVVESLLHCEARLAAAAREPGRERVD